MVLPAIIGNGYQSLDIQDGGAASWEFLRVMWGDVADDERQRVRPNLEDYCALDTGGMISIVDAWRSLIESPRASESAVVALERELTPSQARHS
jgi:hypothetical protein